MWNIFDGFYKEKKLGINLFINESLHQTKWKMEKSKKELERIESQNHTRYIYYVPNVKILPSIASRWQQIRIANTPIPIFFEIFAKIRPSIVYISIPFDSQRIAYAWPFLTENRYCARGGSLDNKTLIPRFLFAPSKQITFYSARISAEYSICNPSRTTPRRSLRDSIIARWVHPGFIRDTRFLIALPNVNDGRWSAG